MGRRKKTDIMAHFEEAPKVIHGWHLAKYKENCAFVGIVPDLVFEDKEEAEKEALIRIKASGKRKDVYCVEAHRE